LLARVGALLKKKLSVSIAALEAAAPNSPLEAFLLRADLLAAAATLDTAAVKWLAQSAALDTPLAVDADDGGMRVICLDDEVDAASAWTTDSAQPLSIRTNAAAPARISARDSAGTEGAGAVFGEDHLSRTRLKLMTSASAAERIEALRVLAYAPLTSRAKGRGAAARPLRRRRNRARRSRRAAAESRCQRRCVNRPGRSELWRHRAPHRRRRQARQNRHIRSGGVPSPLNPPAKSKRARSSFAPCPRSKRRRARAEIRLLALLFGRAQTLGVTPNVWAN